MLENRRRRTLSWLVVIALVAAVGVTVAAPAVSGPQPLTLTKAKKLFVNKKKAQKTYLTKSAAAAYLTKTSAASTYLPRTGESRVVVPPGSWLLADSTDDLSVTVQTSATVVTKSATAANDVDLLAMVPLPTMLGGVAATVVGVEVCYAFPNTALDKPVLDRISLQSLRPGAAAVPGLSVLRSDETGRVDDACTTTRFAPVTLQPNEAAGIGLRFDFADANTQVRLGIASLILTT